MSYPIGNAPDGAYVVGSRYGQDETPDGVNAKIRGQTLGGFKNAQTGFKGLFSGFLNLAELISNIVGAITGGAFFNLGGLSTYSTEQRTNQIVLANRVEQLLTGGTRYTYMIDTTWTNPGPGKLIGVCCIGAGMSGASSLGGLGAKYVYQEFKSESLPATVAIDVGTSAGSGSAFGNLLSSGYSGGGIMTAEGIIVSAGDAGNGGNGPVFVEGPDGNYVQPGTSGGGNALAAGGIYNHGGIGAQGADAPSNRIANAGGGGGAGGGYFNNLVNNQDRRGGPGGWPGGGGGAGGLWHASVGTNMVRHAAGAGAPGAVFVTIKG